MSADFYLRMASYCDAMATAHRILASASAIDPVDSEDDRVRRAGEQRDIAATYAGSAACYRRIAANEGFTTAA